MITSRKLLIRFLFIAIAFSIIVQFAEATTMNFTVHSGEDVPKSISLAVDDRVLIKFTVVQRTDRFISYGKRRIKSALRPNVCRT